MKIIFILFVAICSYIFAASAEKADRTALLEAIRAIDTTFREDQQARENALVQLVLGGRDAHELAFIRDSSSFVGLTSQQEHMKHRFRTSRATGDELPGLDGYDPSTGLAEPTPQCRRIMNGWLSQCVFGAAKDGK